MRPLPIVGLLHPDPIGAAVALALRRRAALVIWPEQGASAAATKRAEWADFTAVPAESDVLQRSDLVIAATADGGVEIHVGASVVAVEVAGPPPWRPGTSVLRLRGPRAGEVAALFAGGPATVEVLD